MVVVALGLAGLIVFGTASPPAKLTSVSDPMRRIDFSDLPPLQHFAARDGQVLSYRLYPGTGPDVVVLIHGSSGESSGMHAAAKTLSVRWFNGLPIIAFAVDPHASVPMDATYSYRIQATFTTPQDGIARLSSIKQPLAVLVGSEDELLYADRFAPLSIGSAATARAARVEEMDVAGKP